MVTLLYGQQYAAAVPLLQLLLGVVIFDVMATPIVLLPLAYGRAHQMALADGLRAVVLAGVALALVPVIGAVGAVAARFASRLSGALLIVWLLGKGPAAQVQHEEAASVSQAG